MIGNRLEGDGTWPWLHAVVDGADIVVRGTVASWFDDETTASGISANAPGEIGCALPMRIHNCAGTVGSPIPALPYRLRVQVYCPHTGAVIEAHLIDVGPAKTTKRGLDLTRAAFRALGLDPEAGTGVVDYRIVGGAEYVKY